MRWVVITMFLVACSESRGLGGLCEGDECAATIHPVDFDHGREFAARGHDLATCEQCHGKSAQAPSCTSCHAEGPTGCKSCHHDGPTTNAHDVHLSNAVACNECHVVPETWRAPGHLVEPVPVVFGPRAGSSAAWNGTSCENVYCHGSAKPAWNATPVGGCTNCHGDPPPSHARTDCATCHPANAPHIDGIVQIGRDATCTGCHTNQTGAHRAHVEGVSRIAAPIACTTCHVVPASVTSPGHIDSPAPAEVIGSCTSCHGTSSPAWSSHGEVFCGTCHGVPPATASHATATSLSTCATCHPRTVDAFGNILVGNGAHIDGVVDLQ